MRPRAGAALLEALAALVLLSTALVAFVTLVHQSHAAVERARSADRELAAASAFLDAVVLWPREDLDRRLGDRAQGDWRLRIQRPEPRLYTIVLTDATGGRVLLETAVYRPAPRATDE